MTIDISTDFAILRGEQDDFTDTVNTHPRFVSAHSQPQDVDVDETLGCLSMAQGFEVSITTMFQDDQGRPDCTVSRTTISLAQIQVDSRRFRGAIEQFYTSLGYTVTSVQVCVERIFPMDSGWDRREKPDRRRGALKLIPIMMA